MLDTNVILHDSACIYHFQENDLVIPIPVLEELDQFKKGNESINYHAREFVRTLDSLSGDKLFDGGIEIAPGLGKISIKLERKFHADLAFNFSTQKADDHILNIAYCLAKETPNRQVLVVTKDVNFRMKAKAVNLMAQDYTSDHVKDVFALYTGHRTEEYVPEGVIARLYAAPHELALAD